MYKLLFLLLFSLTIIKKKYTNDISPNEIRQTQNKNSLFKNELSILSLNTWGLPIKLAGHDQESRFHRMPTAITHTSADIVCLQECFSKSLRDKLKENLTPYYENVTDIDCERTWKGLLNMDCYGGLVTMSSYPIIQEEFVPFTDGNHMGIIEKIGAKGFLITTIDLAVDTINIVNTHLYSGNNSKAEKSRLLQVLQIESHLKGYLKKHPHNTIIVGDLNIAHPDIAMINDHIELSPTYTYLESNMCLLDSKKELSDRDFTMDPNQNPYSSHKDGGRQKLDYCMILDCNPFKSISFIESNVVLSGDNAVSDHMGLLSRVHLSNQSNALASEIELHRE